MGRRGDAVVVAAAGPVAPRVGCRSALGPDGHVVVTDKRVELDLDEAGVSADLPRPEGPADEVQRPWPSAVSHI